jgi:acyl-CoA thioesterase FadM
MKGHVSHPAILTRWFQECRRFNLLMILFPASYGSGVHFLVAENKVELLQPIPLYQQVVVRTALDYVGSSSVVFFYQVDSLPFRSETDNRASSTTQHPYSLAEQGTTITFATGTCRLVFCDSTYSRKVSLPPENVEVLKQLGARVLPAPALPSKDPLPTDSETWPFRWSHQVLTRDLDANEHLNNCAVFYFLEEARLKYIEQLQQKLKTEFNNTAEATNLATLEWQSYRVLYFKTVLPKEILNVRVRVEAVQNDTLHFAFYLTTGATTTSPDRPCHYAMMTARYEERNNNNNKEKDHRLLVPAVVITAIESLQGKSLALDKPPQQGRGNKL